MATTLRDAYEIYELATSHPAVFQIGLQYRFKAIYAEAIREALRGRALGTIRTINLLEHRIPFLDKVGQWNKFSRFSGGTLVEKCCHYFDLCNLFAGSRPKRVYASGSMSVNFREFEYRGQKSDILDNATVVVEYGNGARATFSLCMFAPMFCEELILCGDEGRLLASEREDFLAGPRLKTRVEISCGANRPSRTGSPSYPSFIEDSGHNGATYFEHVKFVDDIEGGRSDAATALEGFWSIAVGIAAETSARTGSLVDIDALLAENGIKLPGAAGPERTP
jgi:myo-inositol 2-dehydrogenase / D-chiro-inositol 1-dehydrogenase